jgi:hypothetical protein
MKPSDPRYPQLAALATMIAVTANPAMVICPDCERAWITYDFAEMRAEFEAEMRKLLDMMKGGDN